MDNEETGVSRLLSYLPDHIADAVRQYSGIKGLQEIRIRAGQGIQLCFGSHDVIVGQVTDDRYTLSGERPTNKEGFYARESKLTVTIEDCREILERICHYSVYAWESELEQGFITLPGGYRVGMLGRALMEQGRIKRIDIPTFYNFRIAQQIKSGAVALREKITDGYGILLNTMLISPPGGGKTTLLRDIARCASEGSDGYLQRKVCIIDERSEIAGAWCGIPQNDVGPRTDVLDGCPKAQGILWALRTMSPQVVVCDELGASDELEAAIEAAHCGVTLLATAHGRNYFDIMSRWKIKQMELTLPFERYVTLCGQDDAGKISAVLDAEGHELVSERFCLCGG